MINLNNSKFKIRWLASSTTDDWLNQALDHPNEILIDHAHCERKAAGAALQLMFRYISEPGLSEVLSPLVREELEHFERDLSLIQARGRTLVQLPAPPYGALLTKNIRKHEPSHGSALLSRSHASSQITQKISAGKLME